MPREILPLPTSIETGTAAQWTVLYWSNHLAQAPQDAPHAASGASAAKLSGARNMRGYV
jgi:hypothetical protein